jgi:transcriptional antiterminator RfaH
VLRPLFPRYLFVALDLSVDRWRAVQATVGIGALIMNGDRPQAAPAGLVEGMMACSDTEAGFVLRTELEVGSRVRFLTGPFEDRLGRLVEMRDAERVTVLLEILGAEREVVVSPGRLLSAER